MTGDAAGSVLPRRQRGGGVGGVEEFVLVVVLLRHGLAGEDLGDGVVDLGAEKRIAFDGAGELAVGDGLDGFLDRVDGEQEDVLARFQAGLLDGLVDFGKGQIVPYAELLEEMIALVAEDAERLDCVAEVAATRDIIRRGTSAHRQVAIHADAAKSGADPRAALVKVVDFLSTEFTQGL